MKPSTDQVFQNTLSGFGFLVRWVSRSAMWMPLTPAFFISLAQPSRSSCAGSSNFEAEIVGEVDQRLLDEPRDHARIGAADGDRRSCRPGSCGFSSRTVSRSA